MYTLPAFRMDDRDDIRQMIAATPLAQFITAHETGPAVTPLPLFYVAEEGPHGTLYGHLARANAHWKRPIIGEALALFSGPDAYVTPSWYASKQETGKVVPTWNYVAIEAFGEAEFFDDRDRLLDVVTRLTNLHEARRSSSWQVSDAPADFIDMQLRAIVGLRLPITRLEGKRKMSQNRSEVDRAGVKAGLAASDTVKDQLAAEQIP